MKALVARELCGPSALVYTEPGWSAAVRECTGGRVAVEGRLTVIGFAAGGIPTVKVNRLMLRNAGVLGVGWREYLMANPGGAQEYADGVAQLVADELRPLAPQRFPLADGRSSLEALAAGRVRGKLVLEP